MLNDISELNGFSKEGVVIFSFQANTNGLNTILQFIDSSILLKLWFIKGCGSEQILRPLAFDLELTLKFLGLDDLGYKDRNSVVPGKNKYSSNVSDNEKHTHSALYFAAVTRESKSSLPENRKVKE